MTFTKATKQKAKLRLALIGPSGSGKTYTALRIAKGFGSRIAVLDTEHGSASKYAGQTLPEGPIDFDTMEPTSFAPETYVEAIAAAEEAGYDVLVIDSLSHAWMGKDGALEAVDKAAAKSKSGNTFTAWRDVTPRHQRMIDAILGARVHIIATMRSKTEYVLEENSRGQKVPRKVGMAPVQRDGMEYEFDITADLDIEHRLIVSKSRCPSLDGAVIEKPGADVAEMLLSWLDDGEARPVEPGITDDQRKAIMATFRELGIADEKRHAWLRKNYGKSSLTALTRVEASDVIDKMKAAGKEDDDAAHAGR
jgi:hypothetical protein